jgi:hypothetical protein
MRPARRIRLEAASVLRAGMTDTAVRIAGRCHRHVFGRRAQPYRHVAIGGGVMAGRAGARHIRVYGWQIHRGNSPGRAADRPQIARLGMTYLAGRRVRDVFAGSRPNRSARVARLVAASALAAVARRMDVRTRCPLECGEPGMAAVTILPCSATMVTVIVRIVGLSLHAREFGGTGRHMALLAACHAGVTPIQREGSEPSSGLRAVMAGFTIRTRRRQRHVAAGRRERHRHKRIAGRAVAGGAGEAAHRCMHHRRAGAELGGVVASAALRAAEREVVRRLAHPHLRGVAAGMAGRAGDGGHFRVVHRRTGAPFGRGNIAQIAGAGMALFARHAAKRDVPSHRPLGAGGIAGLMAGDALAVVPSCMRMAGGPPEGGEAAVAGAAILARGAGVMGGVVRVIRLSLHSRELSAARRHVALGAG